MATQSRSNQVKDTRVKPFKKFLSIKGFGKITVYDSENKGEKKQVEKLERCATLVMSYFLYSYNEKTKIGIKSTEYQFKKDTIKIYETKPGSTKGNKVYEGPAEGEALEKFTAELKAKELSVSKGCCVYGFLPDTGEFVRVEMAATSRGLFFDLRNALNSDYPDFTISGFKQVTPEMRKEINKKAGRTVSVPDFVPIFESCDLSEYLDTISKAEKELLAYFNNTPMEEIEAIEEGEDGDENKAF